jgi:hypothetical protein
MPIIIEGFELSFEVLRDEILGCNNNELISVLSTIAKYFT